MINFHSAVNLLLVANKFDFHFGQMVAALSKYRKRREQLKATIKASQQGLIYISDLFFISGEIITQNRIAEQWFDSFGAGFADVSN